MYAMQIRFKDSKIIFENTNDEILFKSISEQGESLGIKFKLTLEELTDNSQLTTEKQHRLWKWLVWIVSEESGSTYAQVESDFMHHTFRDSKIQVEDLDNENFSKLLNTSIDLANEFYNMNLKYNEEQGRFEI